MAATWGWLYQSVPLVGTDTDSGSIINQIPIGEDTSVQRIILQGGGHGWSIQQHTAPGAGRIPSPYSWQLEIRTSQESGAPTEQRLFRTTTPNLGQFSWSETFGTTTVMTWVTDPSWWEADFQARFKAGPGGGYVLAVFSWSNGHPTEQGVARPDVVWNGNLSMFVLTSF